MICKDREDPNPGRATDACLGKSKDAACSYTTYSSFGKECVEQEGSTCTSGWVAVELIKKSGSCTATLPPFVSSRCKTETTEAVGWAYMPNCQ